METKMIKEYKIVTNYPDKAAEKELNKLSIQGFEVESFQLTHRGDIIVGSYLLSREVKVGVTKAEDIVTGELVENKEKINL